MRPRISRELNSELSAFVRDFRGAIDLGLSHGGVIENRLFFTGDEIIAIQSMPAQYVQQCMDEVARLSENAKRRRPGGYIRGRIPEPIYWAWRCEWQKGPRLHGVIWRAFLDGKLKDRDYSKFRVKGV